MCIFAFLWFCRFQSTHPRRVWPQEMWSGCTSSGFNPHTHEGCDFVMPRNRYLLSMFQSTHPRRVWRYDPDSYGQLCKVSIHTPTKGVTSHLVNSGLPEEVSIHTPTKGVTLERKYIAYLNKVSIHTPTKGVTLSLFVSIFLLNCFNPHTHEGCDRISPMVRYDTWGFQSTHPRRVWLSMASFVALTSIVSIHTPTKGVTRRRWRWWCRKEVSIHTPTKGVTAIIPVALPTVHVSIHTPTKGVTGKLVRKYEEQPVSIHTPTKGVTAKAFQRMCRPFCFNPHTHEGCDTIPAKVQLVRHLFQSTHPRRVWPETINERVNSIIVSIHTPTKGVTQLEATINKLVKVSIHTPTKGVTTGR